MPKTQSKTSIRQSKPKSQNHILDKDVGIIKQFNITVNNMPRILMGKRQKYARTEGKIEPVRKKF